MSLSLKKKKKIDLIAKPCFPAFRQKLIGPQSYPAKPERSLLTGLFWFLQYLWLSESTKILVANPLLSHNFTQAFLSSQESFLVTWLYAEK